MTANIKCPDDLESASGDSGAKGCAWFDGLVDRLDILTRRAQEMGMTIELADILWEGDESALFQLNVSDELGAAVYNFAVCPTRFCQWYAMPGEKHAFIMDHADAPGSMEGYALDHPESGWHDTLLEEIRLTFEADEDERIESTPFHAPPKLRFLPN